MKTFRTFIGAFMLAAAAYGGSLWFFINHVLQQTMITHEQAQRAFLCQWVFSVTTALVVVFIYAPWKSDERN